MPGLVYVVGAWSVHVEVPCMDSLYILVRNMFGVTSAFCCEADYVCVFKSLIQIN